jgi:hypothetical protein
MFQIIYKIQANKVEVLSKILPNVNYSLRQIQYNLEQALCKSNNVYQLYIKSLFDENKIEEIILTDLFFDTVFNNLLPAPQGYYLRLSFISSDGTMLRDSFISYSLIDKETKSLTMVPLLPNPGKQTETPLVKIGVNTSLFGYIDTSTPIGSTIWNSVYLQPVNQRTEVVQAISTRDVGYSTRVDIYGKFNTFVAIFIQYLTFSSVMRLSYLKK